MVKRRRSRTGGGELGELAEIAARGLREGTLHLRHVVGLTDVEMSSIARAAAERRRAGRPGEAAALYALLATHDPLQPRYWSALAEVYEQQGQYAAAVACYETLALVGDREAGCTSREARCLARMNQPALADEMAELAAALRARRA